ncbi:MAG TPA: TIGR03984 family CRISPR-associated protein [Chloroflexi bacterium]|nr:TIGR03984 family CRISPR-associated protein [Chloroflexota bacterium]HHW87399.1 TIGR03984 family CRISPR-associated protein [Chloroflexota bacterium]
MSRHDVGQSLQLPAQVDLVWLGEQADEHGLRWLLVHADDGINWGERRARRWVLSHDVAPEIAPAFVPEHVQQVRLFDEAGELLIWREGKAWRGRWLTETSESETTDVVHLLWGVETEPLQNGFVLLNEGAEGLRHAPPAVKQHFDPAQERAALHIRHHLAYDDSGQVYIRVSRLVGLGAQLRNKGE